MIQLTKEEIDAIEADAESYNQKMFDTRIRQSDANFAGTDYIAGATSRAIKAKELVEALEKISTQKISDHHYAYAYFQNIAKQALLNYNKP